MYKHYYKPFYYSFSKGNHNIDTFKCKYCGKVVDSFNINDINRKNAYCKQSLSKSTIKELVNNKYDCLIFIPSLKYRIIKTYNCISQQINITYKSMTKKIKIVGMSLWLYIMSLKIK